MIEIRAVLPILDHGQLNRLILRSASVRASLDPRPTRMAESCLHILVETRVPCAVVR
jgi:hypothetical protein